MSTTTKAPEYKTAKPPAGARKPLRSPWRDEGAQHCLLEGISWETYEAILKDTDERPIFLTYDHGTLEIMSPSLKHDRARTLAGRLLALYALEADIPMESCGMMTMRRKKLKQGLEADECYYIANAAKIRAVEEFGPATPAPDLAVEIEVSRRLGSRKEIYAALGVAELWLDDGTSLRALHLQPNGEYEQKHVSLNFPRLPLKTFERFLRMRAKKTEHEIVREFQQWARSHLGRSQS